ncbi:c-type cytochrome biogenesis protein CcmI [Salinibius halmophilus]|uniref:c-type cytochrome biogenesis protein CcmI n=1 Tax=Salinibius halmophilus TaxID=1853216 RepID=UPI000E65FCD5|nr:c-type cytochrome biogenesis protein CcmI [Salinibius halmophilus]
MFWLVAGVMTAIAGLALYWGWQRNIGSQLEHARWQTQVRIARKRIDELKLSLEEGEIDQLAFDLEEAEIARPLLSVSQKQQLNRRLPMAWVAVPVLFVAISSVLLYQKYGAQEGLQLLAMRQAGIDTPAERNEALQVWQAWQDKRPKDIEGWLGLALAYSQGGRFEQAEQAFLSTLAALNRQESPAELDEAYVYANLAQNRFNQNQQQFDQQTELWLDKALELNPDSELGLGLRGVQGFANEDWLQVITAWNRLLPMLENAQERAAIQGAMAQARSAYVNAGGDPAALAAIEGVGFDVLINLEADRLNLEDYPVLFLIARPQGATMPVAVRRVLVDRFPMTVRLSSLDSMGNGISMLDFESLEIVARLSQSGSAIAQEGDWQSAPVLADIPEDYVPLTLSIDQPVR